MKSDETCAPPTDYRSPCHKTSHRLARKGVCVQGVRVIVNVKMQKEMSVELYTCQTPMIIQLNDRLERGGGVRLIQISLFAAPRKEAKAA